LRWKGLNRDWKVAEEDAFSARRRIIIGGRRFRRASLVVANRCLGATDTCDGGAIHIIFMLFIVRFTISIGNQRRVETNPR
jgi:hypothetical protein